MPADECKTLIDKEIDSALCTGVIVDTTPDEESRR